MTTVAMQTSNQINSKLGLKCQVNFPIITLKYQNSEWNFSALSAVEGDIL